MRRLTTAALVLGALLGAPPLNGQAPSGGGQAPPRARTRVDDAELARELAREQAERRELVARVEALAAKLAADDSPGGPERRRLQAELEASIRQLTETHARVAVDVGSRILIDRRPAVATGEVRRLLGDAQRRLTSAAHIGYMGITLSPTNNHVRVEDAGGLFVRYFQYPSIISVEPGSPAERAGLQRGDLVLAYNQMDVRRELPMHDLLRPGNRVTVGVRRDGREHDVELTVASPPANVLGRRADFMVAPDMPGAVPPVPSVRATARASRAVAPVARGPEPAMVYRFDLARGIAGAELSPITGGLGAALGVKRGLLVMRVAPRSPASLAGLRDGDIVVKADGEVVEDIGALSRIMRERDDEGTLKLETLRAKRKRTVTLTW